MREKGIIYDDAFLFTTKIIRLQFRDTNLGGWTWRKKTDWTRNITTIYVQFQ